MMEEGGGDGELTSAKMTIDNGQLNSTTMATSPNWSANRRTSMSSKRPPVFSLPAKCCLLLTTLIIFILLFLLLWPRLTSSEKEPLQSYNNSTTTPKFCLSRECIRIASTILERIDPEADACDDMYAFACGNFIASNDVPEDYYARNLLQEIQEGVFVEMKHSLEKTEPENSSQHHILQIKRLYNSCMEADTTSSTSSSGIDGILLNTDELGGSSVASMANRGPLEALYRLIIQLTGVEWPVLSFGNWTPPEDSKTGQNGFSLERQLALLYLYQVQPFFQLFVAPHRNTSSYALHIFPGSTVMEQLHFSLTESRHSSSTGSGENLDSSSGSSGSTVTISEAQSELYKSFQREVIKAFLALAKNLMSTEIDARTEYIDEQLDEMFAFEMELVNIIKEIAQSENAAAIASTAKNCTATAFNGHSAEELEVNITENSDFCPPISSSTSTSEEDRASSQQQPQPLQLNPALFLNVSVDRLESDFSSSFSWSTFFRAAFEEPANVTLSDTLIHSHEYLRSLVDLLANTKDSQKQRRQYSRQTINNYLGWATVAKYMPYLGAAFRHLSADFQAKSVAIPVVTATSGNAAETTANTGDSGGDSSGGGGGPSNFKFYNSRWKQCVYIACESLKVPAISLYLDRHRPPDQLDRLGKRIGELIASMKQGFLSVIDSQTWLNRWPAVRAALKRRVATISANIGVPEPLRNGSHVRRLYERLEVNASAELISNIFAIARHETVIEARKLLEEKVAPGGEWLFQPLDANAFYDFTSNDIIIPIGIVRSPLVTDHIPKYLELPFLGIVIGHEIAHSLDVNSRKHMAEQGPGNASSGGSSLEAAAAMLLLVNQSAFAGAYKRKAQCFSETFSRFKIDEADTNVNGNNTLEENICDFASFQTAYSIFRSFEADSSDLLPLPGLGAYTTEQVFFIRYAQLWCEVATREGHMKSLQDNHSPGRFRANGVLMNSRSFARAFNCSTTARMNPPEKCDLWSAGH